MFPNTINNVDNVKIGGIFFYYVGWKKNDEFCKNVYKLCDTCVWTVNAVIYLFQQNFSFECSLTSVQFIFIVPEPKAEH